MSNVEKIESKRLARRREIRAERHTINQGVRSLVGIADAYTRVPEIAPAQAGIAPLVEDMRLDGQGRLI